MTSPHELTATEPPERDRQVALTPGQHAKLDQAHKEAAIAKSLSLPAAMAVCSGMTQTLTANGLKVYVDNLLEEEGNPTDPIERMMIEQFALARMQIPQLHAKASTADSVEATKQYASAAVRLTGEFRRLGLAIKKYRQPAERRRGRSAGCLS